MSQSASLGGREFSLAEMTVGSETGIFLVCDANNNPVFALEDEGASPSNMLCLSGDLVTLMLGIVDFSEPFFSGSLKRVVPDPLVGQRMSKSDTTELITTDISNLVTKDTAVDFIFTKLSARVTLTDVSVIIQENDGAGSFSWAGEAFLDPSPSVERVKIKTWYKVVFPAHQLSLTPGGAAFTHRAKLRLEYTVNGVAGVRTCDTDWEEFRVWQQLYGKIRFLGIEEPANMTSTTSTLEGGPAILTKIHYLEILEEINRIWAQAGICFELADVEPAREVPVPVADRDDLFKDGELILSLAEYSNLDHLFGLPPAGNDHQTVVNIFLMKGIQDTRVGRPQFRTTRGLGLGPRSQPRRGCDLNGIVLADGCFSVDGEARTVWATVGHEVGHWFLGHNHLQGATGWENLMHGKRSQKSAVTLNRVQINAARSIPGDVLRDE
jgi:hypothetical protein